MSSSSSLSTGMPPRSIARSAVRRQAVSMGVADLGIVGLNEVAEKGFPVEQIMDLGFGGCRLSLAVPKTTAYEGLAFFRGRRVATS